MTDKPTTPGTYWYRTTLGEWRQVEVTEHGGHLLADVGEVALSNVDTVLGTWGKRVDTHTGGSMTYWCSDHQRWETDPHIAACEEQDLVFDHVVSCELPAHSFDPSHPCQATLIDHNGIVWHLRWFRRAGHDLRASEAGT